MNGSGKFSRAVVDRAVQLPDVLEAAERVQLRERGRRGALPRAVVRDGDPRLERLEHRRQVGVVVGVVRHEVDVDRPDELIGQIEIAEPVANQIADVEKAERAVAHAHANRSRVLAAKLSAGLDAVARRTSAVPRRRAAASGFAPSALTTSTSTTA